ncbi:MAG TPA: hypothetical protein VGB87_22915 [Vicinamibacteria bacterium]
MTSRPIPSGDDKAEMQPALALRPTAEDAFRADDLDAEVVFKKVDGVVKGLTLKQGGKETAAERK